MSILIFIVALAILILVHEFGHFIVAKKSGIRVDEFGLGFPPKVYGKKIGETVYSINAIPFGGFVKIFGEDPHSQEISEADKPRSFFYKPKWIQALVLVAGVTFNIIFAWILISLGFMLGLPSPVGYISGANVSNAHTVIINVFPGSPAEKAGLRAGDTILSVGAGKNVLAGDAIPPEKISELIAKSLSEKIDMTYKRGAEASKNISLTPNLGGKRMIGISMDTIGTVKLSFFGALYEGGRTTILLVKSTVTGLFGFLYNIVTFHFDLSQVAGPVGIAGSFSEAKDLGFVYILSLVALISINLAVINLIPFPALDGGRLFFILIEKIIRRPIPPKIFQWTNAIGFALLLVLMIVITGHDILKLL
ncbi:MAG: site-2 protease family protein [bacterium]